jgi:hypothetical protein
VVKHDQPTSHVTSRRSSHHKEKYVRPLNISSIFVCHLRNTTPMNQTDQFKIPFFHIYEIIYKFRHSIINLLEQNKFLSLADRLQMIKQLSSEDDNITNDFVENSERLLKDIVKVLQTCMATLISTINEYQTKEPETIIEAPSHDDQQSLILQQKEWIINDLTTKYDQLTHVLNQANAKHQDDFM